MSTIFISHSSLDEAWAIRVRDWLVANGWPNHFLDLDPARGIKAGERWKTALRNAAHRCEVVLALVSRQWLASSMCRAELEVARLINKKIITALIDEEILDLPADLTEEQWVDLVHDPSGFVRLKEGLKAAGISPESFYFEPGRCPYPGFHALDERDAAVFFGREAQILRGLDKLRGIARVGVERLMVVLGASGAGKSSFLRAGLLPRL